MLAGAGLLDKLRGAPGSELFVAAHTAVSANGELPVAYPLVREDDDALPAGTLPAMTAAAGGSSKRSADTSSDSGQPPKAARSDPEATPAQAGDRLSGAAALKRVATAAEIQAVLDAVHTINDPHLVHGAEGARGNGDAAALLTRHLRGILDSIARSSVREGVAAKAVSKDLLSGQQRMAVCSQLQECLALLQKTIGAAGVLLGDLGKADEMRIGELATILLESK